MRGLSRSSVTELPVGPKYWRGRIESVDRDFELLPVQLARLANITRLIDEIEQAIDQTKPETRRSIVFEKSPD